MNIFKFTLFKSWAESIFNSNIINGYVTLVILTTNSLKYNLEMTNYSLAFNCVNNKMLEYDWLLTAHIYSLILLCNSKTVRWTGQIRQLKNQ